MTDKEEQRLRIAEEIEDTIYAYHTYPSYGSHSRLVPTLLGPSRGHMCLL